MRFEHLVITRFNLRVSDTPAGEDWLRHRLFYFKNVCCPAIGSQTNQNFRWIVLFDSVRESWFESEVQALAAGGLFEPIWLTGRLTPQVAASLGGNLSSADWLITSRVDNDDAIARDFIALVQENFRGQEFEFLNFQSGLQMTDSGELFVSMDPSSAFISLIEKRTSIDTLPRSVYLCEHTDVEHYGPMRQVKSHPMWLQMVHGRNIGNQVQGVRAKPELLKDYFDIELTASPISRTALAMTRGASAASLAWRVLQKPSRIVRLGRVIRNRLLANPTGPG